MLINPYQFSFTGDDVIALGVAATSAQNGFFQYLRKASATGSSNFLTYSGTPGNFIGPESFNLPMLAFTNNNLFMHPGSTSTAVAIRWSSNVTRTIAISGRFVKDTTTGTSDGVRVSVYKNNATAVISPVLINSTNPVYVYTNVVVSMAANDYLDFQIDNNINVSSDHTNCTLLRITYL